MQFLKIDGPVFRFLETLTNLIILNLLFLVCSIPIVTIGPSLTATYYVALKIVRKEETGIVKSFFHSFRTNFKQGLILGLGVILAAAVLILDIQILSYIPQIPEIVSKVFLVLTVMLLLILSMTAIYLFAVLAQFDNKLTELVKWSAIIAIRHLPVSLLCLVMAAAPFVVFYLYPAFFLRTIFPILLLLGFSGIAYMQAFFYVRVFSYYMPTEDTERTEENEE